LGVMVTDGQVASYALIVSPLEQPPKSPGLDATPLITTQIHQGRVLSWDQLLNELFGCDGIISASMGCKDPALVALTGIAVFGRGLVNCKQGSRPFRTKGAFRKLKAAFAKRKAALLKA